MITVAASNDRMLIIHAGKKLDRCATYLFSNMALWTTTVEHIPITNNQKEPFFLFYFSAPRSFLLLWKCAHVMHVLSNNTALCEMEWQWKVCVCVCVIKLLRTYVWDCMRGTAVSIAFYVRVSDPDNVYDTVTHRRPTDCSVSVCVRAYTRNQVAPSTTHANILFNMFPPRLFWGREGLNKEDRERLREREKWEKCQQAFALLSSCKTSIQFSSLPASMRISRWINSCLIFKNQDIKKISLYRDPSPTHTQFQTLSEACNSLLCLALVCMCYMCVCVPIVPRSN